GAGEGSALGVGVVRLVAKAISAGTTWMVSSGVWEWKSAMSRPPRRSTKPTMDASEAPVRVRKDEGSHGACSRPAHRLAVPARAKAAPTTRWLDPRAMVDPSPSAAG